ncbi:MAG: DUF5681 domain-containing protein [Rhodospirillales bacterium]|nr:DUF5681 domain-containing protein [Rhodospirillales bacterium]
MSDEPSCNVGYGRPPQHTRFAKGRSGNPKGRPKGAKNFATLVTGALDERVVVKENGKRRSITKRQAIITQLVNKSAAADLKAIALLLGMVQQIEARGTAAGASVALTTEADRQVMLTLAARLHAAKQGPDDSRP